MGRQYSPKTFLRQVPNYLLKQYFKQKNIQIGLRAGRLNERNIKAIFEVLVQLSPEICQDVETDFTMINELACTAGMIKILEWAQTTGHDWAGKFEDMDNCKRRSKSAAGSGGGIKVRHPWKISVRITGLGRLRWPSLDRVFSWRTGSVP